MLPVAVSSLVPEKWLTATVETERDLTTSTTPDPEESQIRVAAWHLGHIVLAWIPGRLDDVDGVIEAVVTVRPRLGLVAIHSKRELASEELHEARKKGLCQMYEGALV